MSTLRPDRVVAILRRDLALQLHGRQRWVVLGILGALLGPLTIAPDGEKLFLDVTSTVRGDVPESVLAVDGVERVEAGRRRALAMRFRQHEDGLVTVSGTAVSKPVRDALDARDATVVRYRWSEERWPSRGLLLALLAASTLTGSLAQSLPGERSDRTLISLRAAAVSPWEIVAGKWLAWGGFGALSATLAALATVAAGTLDPGWWLAAVPIPSFAAAALGLYLVRTARDVVGGSAVALRTMPAVLGGTGISAVLLVRESPLLAALMPGGGALAAAGGLFDGPGLVAVAAVSSLVPTAYMLHRVAQDLDPPPTGDARGVVAGVLEAGSLAVGWWICVASAGLYDLAGATSRALSLSPAWSLSAGTAFLAVAWAIHSLRRAPPPIARPPSSGARELALVVLGTLMFLLMPTGLVSVLPPGPRVDLGARLGPDALALAGPVMGVGIVIVQEALVRGRLQPLGGAALSIATWVLVFEPGDPVHGLLSGAVLSALFTATGDWRPGAVARALPVAYGVAGLPPFVDGPARWAVLGLAAIAIGVLVRSAGRSPGGSSGRSRA